MQRLSIMPLLAAALLATACGEGDEPTAVGTTARVRFFNATTGMGSGGFTTNGQFAAGSVLSFGQATPTCATIDAGATSFGFGAANTGGTGLSGSALASLSVQSIAAGGNFTLVATGSASSPALFLLDNDFSGSLASNQAAVRFVNLAASAANPFNVLTGTIGSGPTSVTATNLAVGAPTTFSTVAGGSNAFTVLHGHEIAITGSAATLNLQAGSVNTIAIVPDATSGGYRLINVPRC